MRFGSFIEFVENYSTHRLFEDTTYRNYDLLYTASNTRLVKALGRAGFVSGEPSVALDQCHASVRDRGYSLSNGELQTLLQEWFIWDRIVTGELGIWKYRTA